MNQAKTAALQRAYLKKSCEALLGICTGLMADGELNREEIRFLDLWLKEHHEAAEVWPGSVISKRLNDVLADGTISSDEIEYLKKTLGDLIGGTLEQNDGALDLSTSLPLNDDKADPVVFSDTAFCFTGGFLYGTRAACERAVMTRGAQAFSGVTKNLEYLVIGSLSNHDWAHSTYGRKIEKAVEYQQKGAPVLIISEAHWSKYL